MTRHAPIPTDGTRTYFFGRKRLDRRSREVRGGSGVPRVLSDISPAEIEARYQRRLAELQHERRMSNRQ